MMNRIRLALTLAVLSLFATGLLPSNLQAQTWYPSNVFLAAGSSGQFNATAVAALNPVYNGNTPCTGGNASTHWTQTFTLGSKGMQVHDPRPGAVTTVPDEGGTVWIGWDSAFITGMDYDMNGGTEPPAGGTICADVSLDSTLGTRLFFAYGQMILNSPAGTADGGAAAVPLLAPGVTLPAEVVYYFNTLSFPDHGGPHPTMNVGPSDILPDDTKFAEVRAETSPAGAQIGGTAGHLGYAGLGYGGTTCGTVGSQILSSSDSKYFDVVDFVLDSGDIDCFTGQGPRQYSTLDIGADPVLAIVNVGNTAAGHLGDPAFWSGDPQINRGVLANVFSGLNEEVGSITGIASTAPLHVYQREPLSGTYNTFDWNTTCTAERYPDVYTGGTYNCMETGVNPASCPSPGVNCGNPYIFTDTTTGYTRQREIGTGDEVKYTAAGTGDNIGFSFWGFGNFSGYGYSNLRYLPVDNIDPLYPYPGANPGGIGYLPQCPNLPCPHPPFTKIVDGGYPIWTIYRWVVDNGALYGTYYNNVLAYLQAVAANDVYDFVPLSSMQVFRSHYTQLVRTNGQGQYGSNGVASSSLNVPGHYEPELGGDMGGQVFTIQSEINYVNDRIANGTCSWITITNSTCEQLNWKQ